MTLEERVLLFKTLRAILRRLHDMSSTREIWEDERVLLEQLDEQANR